MRLAAACLALAALSLALAPAAPSYDPWAWLLWGREIASLQLDTAEGPAFKPLPVAICALLAPLGGAAPFAWLLLARAGALAAVALAAKLAHDLGAGRLGAVLAGAGIALAGGFLSLAATGTSEGLLVALGLAAILAWRSGLPGVALALGVACALLRVEVWPFLALAAVLYWRAGGRRGAVLAGAVAIPALWFVPELLGSGDPLRSGSRALTPNPGQPALGEWPALESLRQAAPLLLAPLAVGLLAVRRGAAALAAAGLAWVALVAAMSQAGFSGEPRYALPGVALLAVAAATGVVRLPRAGAFVVAAAVALAAVPRLADLPPLRERLAYQARLAGDLPRAVALAGGRDRVLACGRPFVGELRGPLMAYGLAVAKQRVGFTPAARGAIFVSRRTPSDEWTPSVPPGFETTARTATWRVYLSCGSVRDT